ncbi:16S rRNA (cytosine(1402)-N(4))-methyltransferase RsmH [Candidatus Woesebacteria bacterium]|nr:16S rRNA (cytosine(1402)-N(4))-methyltransferase RsmH [Candidatus Woesebacteria bacterium]
MLSEVLLYLGLPALLHTQTKIIDATAGAGGYSREICKLSAKVLGIEADPTMIEIAKSNLKEPCPSFKLIQGNFVNIDSIALVSGFEKVDGIVFDLGVASQQLTSLVRGFSFQNPEAPLDMRLDPDSQGVKAADLLNALDRRGLIALFGRTCGFYETNHLTKRIVEKRETAPFETVGDFLKVTRGIFKKRGVANPATRPFLALRIAVNSELENLESALTKSIRLLKNGGRLVVVSFHSGEDAIVKSFFVNFEREGLGKVLTKKPIVASEAEVLVNPRARSAKLRAFVKK